MLQSLTMGLTMLIMAIFELGFIENVYSMSCMYGYIFTSSVLIAL